MTQRVGQESKPEQQANGGSAGQRGSAAPPLYDPLAPPRRGSLVVIGGVFIAVAFHITAVAVGLGFGTTVLTRRVTYETTTIIETHEEPEPEPPPEPEVAVVEEPEPVAAAEPEPEAAPEEEYTPPDPNPSPLTEGGGPTADGLTGGPGGIPVVPGDGSGRQPQARREEAPAPEPEPEPERAERREPRRPVRLEDAGTPPALTNGDPPIDYPQEFREQAIAGVVVVQCIITENGRVRACRQRSGPDELAEYVISVVRRWRYQPALDHRGSAIAVAFTYRVPFRLL